MIVLGSPEWPLAGMLQQSAGVGRDYNSSLKQMLNEPGFFLGGESATPRFFCIPQDVIADQYCGNLVFPKEGMNFISETLPKAKARSQSTPEFGNVERLVPTGSLPASDSGTFDCPVQRVEMCPVSTSEAEELYQYEREDGPSTGRIQYEVGTPGPPCVCIVFDIAGMIDDI